MLSVVSTLYKSEGSLEEFISRMIAACEKLGEPFEIILVDDGSPDGSLEIATRHAASDSRITVLELSRNFGHHKAAMAGLAEAAGDLVFLIDSDLEEPPEVIEEFYKAKTVPDGPDVVFGVQPRRQGGMLKRMGGKWFYLLFNRLANIELPMNPLTVRIMDATYVRALLSHNEDSVFLAGLFEVTGFKQESIEIEKGCREETSYSPLKRFQLLVDALTSFSAVPLLFSFYLGGLIALFAILAATWVLLRKLFNPELVVQGWASIMISIWFLSGVILISTGLIGLYLYKVYQEVKQRPNFIVRKRHGPGISLPNSQPDD